MNPFLRQLHTRAAQNRRRIAFAESAEERTLRAVAHLQREQLVDCVLVGDAPVLAAFAAAGGDPERIELVVPRAHPTRAQLRKALAARRAHRGLSSEQAEATLNDPMFYAAALVAAGAVDGCIGGAARPTAEVIRAALWCIGPMPGNHTISSSFYLLTRPFRTAESEVLTFTDAGVVPQPTPEQLADIAEAAALARAQIVGDVPRVAFLSYSTRGSARGPAVDAVRRGCELFQQRRPDILSEGEVQADAALIPEVAARKDPGSRLAGSANVLVFPDLNAGNIAYKLVQWLSGADALGPILQGLARPCNDLSRGASVSDIVNVACITALQAGAEQNLPTPDANTTTRPTRGSQ